MSIRLPGGPVAAHLIHVAVRVRQLLIRHFVSDEGRVLAAVQAQGAPVLDGTSGGHLEISHAPCRRLFLLRHFINICGWS